MDAATLRFLTPWQPELFGDPKKDAELAGYARRLFMEMQDIRETFSRASNITIGLPSSRTDLDEGTLLRLEDYLTGRVEGFDIIPAGTIVWYSGSWSTADNLRGWTICDGSNGAPDLMGGKFLRSVADGCDSGCSGGSTTHTHDVHTAADVAAALDDHAAHSHCFCGTTDGGNGSYCTYARGDCTDEIVPLLCDDHCFSGTTDSAAAMEHDGAAGNDLMHSTENHLPPYYELIPLMKL